MELVFARHERGDLDAEQTVSTTYSAEFASGVRADLTISTSGIRCEWTPDMPRGLRGQRRDRFLASYRAWRDECIADYARRTGIEIAVVDL